MHGAVCSNHTDRRDPLSEEDNSIKGRKTGGRDWKPGQSGNPSGTKHLPPEIREMRSAQPYEVAKVINDLAWMNAAETQKVIFDPSTPNIKLAVANCFVKCINDGDLSRLGVLMDRWLGKVKEIVQFIPITETATKDGDKPKMVNSEEIAALMKRAMPKCKK